VLPDGPSQLGVFRDLYSYVEHRHAQSLAGKLPDLPVPEEFKQVLRDWAEGKTDFIGPAPAQ
jgi:hypothetical protein